MNVGREPNRGKGQGMPLGGWVWGMMLVFLLAGGLALGAGKWKAQGLEAQVEEVKATERAFAKTMADRDFEAFQGFLSEEAIFLASKETMRGKAEVAARWKRFYEGKEAPFSWAPEQVEVLEKGKLALSTGPAFGPDGKQYGIFTSIWRKEGREWKIVFDRGCPVCEAR